MTRSTKLVSDPSLLEAALEGLEAQRQRVEEQIQEVRSLLKNRMQSGGDDHQAPPMKRQLSAAARNRIAAAQKKRWAAYRRSSSG